MKRKVRKKGERGKLKVTTQANQGRNSLVTFCVFQVTLTHAKFIHSLNAKMVTTEVCEGTIFETEKEYETHAVSKPKIEARIFLGHFEEKNEEFLGYFTYFKTNIKDETRLRLSPR